MSEASQKQEAPAAPAPEEVLPKNVLALKDAAGQMVSFDYGEDAGAGLELSNVGGRVPYLTLLQPLSNPLKEAHPSFIPAARAGMFCIAPTKTVFDGKAGVNFIGIAEQHIFVEKTALDASGKWVADHAPDSKEVIDAKARGGKKSGMKSNAGNVMVETFRMYGVILDKFEDLVDLKVTPVVVSFERTKLKSRSAFMDRVRAYKGSLPLYAVKAHITSQPEKWEKGDGYGLSVKFAKGDDLLSSLISPNDPAWAAWAVECRKIKKLVDSGQIRGDEATSHDAGHAAADGKDDDIPF